METFSGNLKILQQKQGKLLKPQKQKRRMKKGIWIILFGFVLLGVIAAVLLFSSQKKEMIPQETGTMDLFFCPKDGCEEKLMHALNEAKETIHCAFYDLTLNKTKSLLKNKKMQGIETEIIVDRENYKKIKEYDFAIQAKNKALMHNKFCIIDNNNIITGSMNPTTNDAEENNNNLIIISSLYLAKNYEAEFQEMQEGIYGKGKKTLYNRIIFNNNTLENYFCPEDQCEKHVLEELSKARQTIFFMTFSFTSENIAKMLEEKVQQRVKVQGITEAQRMSRKEEQGRRLQENGVDVLPDNNKHLLHHKVFIIDNTTVIFGSYNPTDAANTKNDENILIINDKAIAEKFSNEFERLRGDQQE